MKFYENIFVVRQDATTSQVEALVADYTQVIKNFGGEVGKTEFCGLRPLAYPIKKNKKGHYVLMNLTTPSPAVVELERLMKLNDSVLRYLTVCVDALDPNPSALMQQRHYNNRDDRHRHADDDSSSDLHITDDLSVDSQDKKGA